MALSPSGLNTTDYGAEDWLSDHNDNWTRLNNVLLKLSALLDVNPAGLGDNDCLIYDSGTSKWIAKHAPGGKALPTTTSSTTTSSSTTSTTSSSTTQSSTTSTTSTSSTSSSTTTTTV